MKLTVSKRILMFFHWLLSLLICAALALFAFAPDLAARCAAKLGGTLGRTGSWIAGIAVLAVYLALAVFQICLILNRKKRVEKGFINVDSGDSGMVRISVSAVEQMVRQSVHSINGISEMRIDIDSEDDALVIGVNAVIQNGCHVPTITMNMQRAIRQFVEVNCGVAVRSVSISINAVANPQETGKRRLLGRVRPERDRITPPVPAKEEPVESAAEPAVTPEPEPAVEEAVEPAAAELPADESTTIEDDTSPAFRPAEAPEPFDIDKPYESEFAKDLAAMRAREAAGNTLDDG